MCNTNDQLTETPQCKLCGGELVQTEAFENPFPFTPDFILETVAFVCNHCGDVTVRGGVVYRPATQHHHHIDMNMLAAMLYGGRDFAAIGMPKDAKVVSVASNGDVTLAYDGPDQLIEWKWLYE